MARTYGDPTGYGHQSGGAAGDPDGSVASARGKPFLHRSPATGRPTATGTAPINTMDRLPFITQSRGLELRLTELHHVFFFRIPSDLTGLYPINRVFLFRFSSVFPWGSLQVLDVATVVVEPSCWLGVLTDDPTVPRLQSRGHAASHLRGGPIGVPGHAVVALRPVARLRRPQRFRQDA